MKLAMTMIISTIFPYVSMRKMTIRGLGMTFNSTKNVSLGLFPPYLVYATCKMMMTLLKPLTNLTSLSASNFQMIQYGKTCI